MRRSGAFPRQAAWLLVAVLPCPAIAATDPRTEADRTAAECEALVVDLGSADYAVRERAAERLRGLGNAAADALLTAAETSADLEVALRARWLVAAIPPAEPNDPPAVAAELVKFPRADYPARVHSMHQLLRMDGDVGIEPLARIVRLERTPAGSRVAAALLAREWRRDDAYWPAKRQRISTGLRTSTRPAARFLRAIAAGTDTAGPEARSAAVEEARAALALLERGLGTADGDGDAADGTVVDATTLRVFRRALVELLLATDRRAEAVEEACRMLSEAWAADAESADELTAGALQWMVDRGLPEAVACLEKRWPGLAIDLPLTAYAAAIALTARGDDDRAATLAEAAAATVARDRDRAAGRLRAALLLARWGAVDWAIREYRAILDDPQPQPAERALAGILFSEFLHDHGRDDEAADVLRGVVDGRRDQAAAEPDEVLRRLERDPRSVRSRMEYFASCAAAARGDTQEARRLVGVSLGHYEKDVDSLIALYHLPDATPVQKDEARARIDRALKQIEDEIQAVPQDANGYNEYAWLVANTEGDVAKATRYSRTSLEMSFDSPSYLDTLAHCQAAAGDHAAAVRTQTLAHRQEPHNVTIRRNLDQFRSRLKTP